LFALAILSQVAGREDRNPKAPSPPAVAWLGAVLATLSGLTALRWHRVIAEAMHRSRQCMGWLSVTREQAKRLVVLWGAFFSVIGALCVVGFTIALVRG